MTKEHMKDNNYLKIYVNDKLLNISEQNVRAHIIGHPTEPSWKEIQQIFKDIHFSLIEENPKFEDIYEKMKLYFQGYGAAIESKGMENLITKNKLMNDISIKIEILLKNTFLDIIEGKLLDKGPIEKHIRELTTLKTWVEAHY